MVEFDPASGWFVLFKLTKISRKRKGMVPFFTASKTSVELTLYVCKVQGANQAAREQLQQMHTDQAQGLLNRIRDLALFNVK